MKAKRENVSAGAPPFNVVVYGMTLREVTRKENSRADDLVALLKRLRQSGRKTGKPVIFLVSAWTNNDDYAGEVYVKGIKVVGVLLPPMTHGAAVLPLVAAELGIMGEVDAAVSDALSPAWLWSSVCNAHYYKALRTNGVVHIRNVVKGSSMPLRGMSFDQRYDKNEFMDKFKGRLEYTLTNQQVMLEKQGLPLHNELDYTKMARTLAPKYTYIVVRKL